MSRGKKITIKDDGGVRESLIADNDCYVEIDEIVAFERMVSSTTPVKFNKDSLGERMSARPESLRLMFTPFMDKQPFMKYSEVRRIVASLVNFDGLGYAEFTIELSSPVYYLETSESEIRTSKIMEAINRLVESQDPSAKEKYSMGGKQYFEMEVFKFEQIFVKSDLKVEVDDISMFFKKKKISVFGDNGVLNAGPIITDTADNREMILRIVNKEGIFNDIFSTMVQFTEKELKELLVPRMKWGKFFEREAARTALNLLINQRAVSQQVFIDVMGKMKGNAEFGKMIKKNKKLKQRFKNDHAILLLIAMS